MPPKAKITKEMILNTVLEITREAGLSLLMPEVFQADYNVPRGLFLHVMRTWRN